MEGPFYTFAEDKGLTITLVREANIALASLPKDSTNYLWQKERYDEAIRVMRTIEATKPQHDNDITFILKTLNTIWDKGILSPLTLKDDEFDSNNNIDDIRHNLRYDYIIKVNDRIYNTNAYKANIRRTYDYRLGTEIENIMSVVAMNPHLYIYKGGIVTGEYVSKCQIRPDVVKKHSFTVQSIINIPASVVEFDDKIICIVDHREPKLKALSEFYNVSIEFNEVVKNMKINIRNYKKL